MKHILNKTGACMLLISLLPAFGAAQTLEMPKVLSVREQASVLNDITLLRLDSLLPGIMQKTGFDMWIIACNEDNLDPVFRTMIPYDTWCPITQLLVFTRKGPDTVERLNLSRTPRVFFHPGRLD